jgi:hypothetical protein
MIMRPIGSFLLVVNSPLRPSESHFEKEYFRSAPSLNGMGVDARISEPGGISWGMLRAEAGWGTQSTEGRTAMRQLPGPLDRIDPLGSLPLTPTGKGSHGA